MQVLLYVVGANPDPDNVHCSVPKQVDDELVFFGPCARSIRKRLREEYLGPSCLSHRDVVDDLFIVGVNAVNPERIRKTIWAGKVSELMTFAEADGRLVGDRFRVLREGDFRPLHVRPLYRSGELVGYEHVGELHAGRNKGKQFEEWVYDLVSNPASPRVRVEGQRLYLRQGTAWQAFDRDCCMLLENWFFAGGAGLDFDDEAVKILKDAQRGKVGIDSYAIFGRTADDNHNVIGRRGSYLLLRDELARRFVAWLESRSRRVVDQFPSRRRSRGTCCMSRPRAIPVGGRTGC